MISEEQHDQAALYALGLLEGDEAAAFDRELAANPELRDVVRELSEGAADLALTTPARKPGAELKQRILRDIAVESQRHLRSESPTRGSSWLPWAIAAALAIFCGILAVDRSRVQRELADARAKDPLAQTAVFALAPSGPAPAEAKATVAWEPESQTGIIRISNLPPAGPGRDYQLWAVAANHKDPVSAGIIKVDANGVAEIRFKPVDLAQKVKAFAISLEREGGVPKAEGPMVLVGSS